MSGGPGYFGKVPMRGDFVRRGLPAGFVAAWDPWLQEGLRHSQARMGQEWLAAYLHAPVWRFALAAGSCGDCAMAGVLMPSVDRVGRHFPLTLAAPVEGLPGEGWFDALEDAALASLAPDATLEALDAALAAIPPTPCGAQAPCGRVLFWAGPPDTAAPALLVHAALPHGGDFAALLAP